jgi:hypothetical protein
MFNGEISRRCFYPLNFYNICFNKWTQSYF